MSGQRTYGDPCGIARALDLVGERWALLVVRELLLGPKRFTDLRAGLPNLSPDVLAQRLRELEAAGVVRRTKLPPPAGSRVYELTEWGRELEQVVLALGRWGSQAPFPEDHGELGIDATMLALKTLFDASRADGLQATYELRIGDQRFNARVSGDQFQIARRTADAPDAVITTDTVTLSELLWRGRSLAAARRTGAVETEGDRRTVERFLKLFPPPVS